MKDNPYKREREEMQELLTQYNNFKAGKKYNFIEEESFERLIDFFDENDQLPQALDAADSGILQYPYSSLLHVKKADVLIAMQRFLEALPILEKAELLDSQDINLYILKTDVYLAIDQPDKAAALLEEAVHIFDGPEKTELLFELADVYDDYEEFDKVFNCLQLILIQDPTNEEALYKICFWTDFTGRNEESILIHQQIIDEHPYTHLAWFNLGAAYQGLKLFEKAVDAYQYAIAIDEKFDYAYRNLGDAYLRLRKYHEAIESLQKVLEYSMPEEVIFEAIGHCYEKLKNPVQARFYYRKAVHLNAVESHLYYKIAQTYMKEANWESAIKNLNSALSIDRSQAEYHLALATCFNKTGHVKDAVIHFTVYIKAKPRNSRGWKELIICLYEAGYYEEALRQANNALHHTGGKPLFLYYKSNVLFALGKSKEALLYLNDAVIQSPILLKHFINLNPSLLQNTSVCEAIGGSKNIKSSRKK